jgi:hypothetical protein
MQLRQEAGALGGGGGGIAGCRRRPDAGAELHNALSCRVLVV